MFKKTRRKIVAAIMSILVLLWVGTLGVIYGSSYFEMRKQNEQMLQTHAQMYTLAQDMNSLPAGKPMPGGEPGFKPGFDPQSPKFRLSNFYSVAIAENGQLLQIKNDPPTVHTNADLENMARHILQEERDTGTQRNLSFCRVSKDGYSLVVFMDNTVVNEGALMLFRYTLLFGGFALILFFFLAVFLSRKIVKPLEESYQKQKQFISDAGHELKTPVSVVSANAELLARQIGDNQWLANITYENQRMGILVGQLLELARTESVTVQPERLDLSHLVAGEALPFESVAFERGFVLRTQVSEGIAADGSSAQLKQLVSIFLDNALRHSSSPGEVCLKLTKEHGAAVLSVTNPGQIPEAQRAQLFQRFYRADPVRNSQDRHYGLGLSIAQAIVTAHHGHVEVFSRNGIVEFRVTLPAVR